MTFVILIVAVAAIVIPTLALHNARRSQPEYRQSTSLVPAAVVDNRPDIARAIGAWLETTDVEPNPSNVLVHPQGDGTAIVFGNDRAVQQVGETLERLPSQLTRLAVGTDAVIKGVITGGELSGHLVRLSDKSVEAMKTLKKATDANGEIIAVLRGDKGQIKHILRFKDTANLQALSGVSGALSAMAVQAQLQRIEQAIAALDAKVSFLVEDVFIEAWATTRAFDEEIGNYYRIARDTGELTTAAWEAVSPRSPSQLAVHHHKTLLRLGHLRRQLEGISRGTKDRTNTLKELLEDQRMLDWLELSLEATRLRSAHEAMRLWRAITVNDPAAPTIAAVLKNDMAERHQLLLDVHQRLITAVEDIPDVKAWRKLNPIRYNKLEKLVDRTSPKMAEITSALAPLAQATLPAATPEPALDPATIAAAELTA